MLRTMHIALSTESGLRGFRSQAPGDAARTSLASRSSEQTVGECVAEWRRLQALAEDAVRSDEPEDLRLSRHCGGITPRTAMHTAMQGMGLCST